MCTNLLRCDWNLIFKSVWAENEIRNRQEFTCSGRRYLETKILIKELRKEKHSQVPSIMIKRIRTLGYFFHPKRFLLQRQFLNHWTGSTPGHFLQLDQYILWIKTRNKGGENNKEPESQLPFQMLQFCEQTRKQRTPENYKGQYDDKWRWQHLKVSTIVFTVIGHKESKKTAIHINLRVERHL